jgi:hypothetical protein
MSIGWAGPLFDPVAPERSPRLEDEELAMALWQLKIELLPGSWLDACPDLAELLDGSFDGAAAWSGGSPDLAEALTAALDEALPRATSWHAELTAWGKDESDDAQLWRAENRIESLGIRVDLRNLSTEWLDCVGRIARKFDLRLLDLETRQFVAPDVRALAVVAGNSRAARFVRDPHGVLSAMKRDPEGERQE